VKGLPHGGAERERKRKALSLDRSFLAGPGRGKEGKIALSLKKIATRRMGTHDGKRRRKSLTGAWQKGIRANFSCPSGKNGFERGPKSSVFDRDKTALKFGSDLRKEKESATRPAGDAANWHRVADPKKKRKGGGGHAVL